VSVVEVEWIVSCDKVYEDGSDLFGRATYPALRLD